jgi:hypothetical protein
VDGEYTIKVLLKRQVYSTSWEWASRTSSTPRGRRTVKRFSVGARAGHDGARSFAATRRRSAWENYMHTADAHLEVRIPVKAGVGRWAPRSSGSTGSLRASSSLRRPATPLSPATYYGNPSVESMMIDGPYNACGKSDDTPSRQSASAARRMVPGGSPGSNRAGVREKNSDDAGHARVSTAGHRDDVQTLLSSMKGASGGQASIGNSARPGTDSGVTELSVPHRAEPANLAAGAPYGSAISNWRRGSHSSSGAAFQTRSC